MLSFTSDFSVHGACESCHISRRGGTTVNTSGLVRLLPIVRWRLESQTSCPRLGIADYPHWQMTPELKRYYLMQASYWCHQLIAFVLRLEKPRKDYKERVAHHLVTSWLIGFVSTFSYIRTHIHTIPRWSYGANLTLIGNAVYASMDIPDFFIATTKMLNYLRWERAQNVMFIVFIGAWT